MTFIDPSTKQTREGEIKGDKEVHMRVSCFVVAIL